MRGLGRGGKAPLYPRRILNLLVRFPNSNGAQRIGGGDPTSVALTPPPNRDTVRARIAYPKRNEAVMDFTQLYSLEQTAAFSRVGAALVADPKALDNRGPAAPSVSELQGAGDGN